MPVTSARLALTRHELVVTCWLSLGLAALFAASLYLGDYVVAPLDVVRSLLSPFTGVQTQGVDFIVLSLRLPRAILAILAGAGFALSGVMFQTLLRNPLASPDIVGISTGASAAAVFAIVVLGWGGALLSFGALAGALLTAVAIYLLAWRDGVSPYRVVLIGIAVSAMLSAVISYLFTRARIFEVQQAMAWLVGSLNAANTSEIIPLALALLILVPTGLLLGRGLSALQLGDDTARALGSRVELSRLSLLLCAVALSAFSTAAVGPVAFVAFVSGPIARKLLGTGRNGFVPTMVVGSCVMLGSDMLAQHALPNTQLPVGVVTGLFGASFLLWLLAMSNRQGRV
ncbi:ABC transporter permease [Devosia pacifica]|uniref:ABC transporter permease n=1 Tax=Devosia pacifica TaxID=1335967 RepID=A0A918SG33_9HYPH|nr:ABC transporter permease [Devosia pacifica]